MTDRDPLSLLAALSLTARSSVIRDLLEHAKRPGVISLAGGIPDPSLFPVAEIAQSAQRVLERDSDVLQYGLTNGEHNARMAVAPLLGQPADPDRIVVTTGSQQGLDLLTKVLINPDDVVLVGDPSYLGALQAFRSHGATLHPLPVDEAGLVVDALEDYLNTPGSPRPKFVYVVSNFQNPTGVVLSEARRSQLVLLAEEHGFLVVEDDPYGQLRYDGVAPPPIGPGSESVVRLRSTSKVLAPGLRVGWMEGPRWLIDAVVVAKQSADLHTSTLSQAIVADLLSDTDWFSEHVGHIRGQYRLRRDAICDALDSSFGSGVTYQRPEGGMFVWARFGDVDMTELLPTALDLGVAFVPASAFMIRSGGSSSARLSFASLDPADFQTATDRLAAAVGG